MKKFIILSSLFIIPIIAYIFFASGVNHFKKLPMITPNLPDIHHWQSSTGEPITLNNKITVLGFIGSNLLENKGNVFNLNQKIYKRYHEFNDFQFVMIAPLGTEFQANELLLKLQTFTDVSHWFFVFASPQEIESYYNRFNLETKLNRTMATSHVFIIDKNRNLRGRNDDKHYREGYNSSSAADLTNIMIDDIKIVLAEYRLALKEKPTTK